ncbi:uncharacterized protein B0J16DRAFT_392719 [Fusarium flagelliforme]|uniref:uncharacterized protein n=1 Tax=Fusarium flagelliforme TaxID=2675880 RepID=UPI001E8E0E71|nr:uncharacterized protein B0J16DRAFT_392719 [Fusarium flagelliforme]KAH7198903.1 hypothetical protein B0J16DRAFT_392719 [Fusarium flagelliforme]
MVNVVDFHGCSPGVSKWYIIHHEWKRLDINARHTSSTSITSDYLFDIVGTAKVSPRANDKVPQDTHLPSIFVLGPRRQDRCAGSYNVRLQPVLCCWTTTAEGDQPVGIVGHVVTAKGVDCKSVCSEASTGVRAIFVTNKEVRPTILSDPNGPAVLGRSFSSKGPLIYGPVNLTIQISILSIITSCKKYGHFLMLPCKQVNTLRSHVI